MFDDFDLMIQCEELFDEEYAMLADVEEAEEVYFEQQLIQQVSRTGYLPVRY